MYRQFFGLTHAPFGKNGAELWNDGRITELENQFNHLLDTPGIGLLIAEPGLGKTSAIRQIANKVNPHQYFVLYISETDFSRADFYRQVAVLFGIEPSYRRMQVWRDIKSHVTHLVTQKCVLPVLIIDEAQNLPDDFLRDLPSFLNFVFDSKDYMTVWLVGHPDLARRIDKPIHTALATRLVTRIRLSPIAEREAFKALLTHGFEKAGCNYQLFSDSGVEILRVASKGNPRRLNQILVGALRMACDRKIRHLPDDLIHEAIGKLQNG